MIVNGKLFSVGGIRDDTNESKHYTRATDDVFIYDVANNSWSQGQNYPHPLWGQAGVVVGNKILTFGGAETDTFNQGNVVDTIYSFTPGGSWNTLSATCPEPTYGFRGTHAPDGNVYLAGGATSAEGTEDTDRIWRFNPSTNSVVNPNWATLPERRRWLSVASASVGSTPYLYVFGGHSVESDTLHSDVTRYPLSGSNEGQAESMTSAPTGFRQALSDCVIDGKVYIAYGHLGSLGSSSDFKPDVYRYDLQSDSWDNKMPSIPNNRARIVGAHGVQNGKIIAAGGHVKDYSTGAHDTKTAVDTFNPSAKVTVGGANIPATNPNDPPKKRAQDAGFTIQNTKTVNRLEDIDGQSNTLYIVDGMMRMSGKHGLGEVNDVAICGKNNARLVVPAEHRDYTLTTSGGQGIMWSGIDLDQRNKDACGGLNLKVEDKGLVEYVQFHGHTGVAGYKGGKDDQGYETSPVLHTPALSEQGLFEIRDINLVSGGWMEQEHEWGVGPIGLFLATQHKGTVHLKNSRFAAFPSDATYATNTTGRVLMDNVNFHTNGTASGRIARGYYKNCTCVFDYKNSPLQGCANTNNACLGLEAEAKQGVSGVDMINCTVKMINVDKCPSAVAARNLTTPGKFGVVKNNDFHVSNNAENAFDVWVNPGSSIGKLVNNKFSGTATGGVSIKNEGNIGTRKGNTFNYPSSRPKYSE